MVKYAVFLLVMVICSVRSQRPWHAGTSGRLPMVLPQYLDERAAAEAAAQASQAGQSLPPVQSTQDLQPGQTIQGVQTTAANDINTVANRIDGAGGYQPTYLPPMSTTLQQPVSTTFQQPASTTVQQQLPSTINPVDLPVDAHGDVELVNRIMTWPRDKQPFWFINWQAIQAHRGDSSNNAQPVQLQPNSRSFFAG